MEMNFPDFSRKEKLLALAAPSFDAYPETFIRNHVRTIAPGQTVLLCEDDSRAEQFGCPVLSPIRTRRVSRTLGQRIVNGMRYRWHAYVDPGLDADDRRRFLEFLDTHRPKALLAEYGPIGCMLAGACQRAKIPLFVYFHGYDVNILARRWSVRRQYRQLFDQTEKVFAASAFMKRRLADLGCDETKIAVIPCGIDTELFNSNQASSKDAMILMVSRLVPQKGTLLSLRSFARAAEKHRQIRLEIIGDGPLRADLEAETRKLGIGSRVQFHGAQCHDFVRACMQAATLMIQHCVTLPGDGTESLGLSILEAMACGLPVVSTRHGAIPETVEDGVTGILVPEGDIDGMADAITDLLDDPERAARMGEAGRSRVLAHFTLESAGDRMRAIMDLRPQTNLQSAA